MNFSIIIPAYNAEEYIERCISSALESEAGGTKIEIIVVDDCSTDSTISLVQKISAQHPQVKLYQTETNQGPGAARNVGLDHATGDWILFLDSDDRIDSAQFFSLHRYILEHDISFGDILAYDFRFEHSAPSHAAGRRDLDSLQKEKNSLFTDYLSLFMDGSVIYTLMPGKLIEQHKIRFHQGIHEDVDFLFKIYYFCTNIFYANNKVYIKNDRQGSIVNSISEDHIRGFFRAYREIYRFLDEQDAMTETLSQAYFRGLIGVLATRIRSMAHLEFGTEALYSTLHQEFQSSLPKAPHTMPFKTKYVQIYEYFESLMNSGVPNIHQAMMTYMEEISPKVWSCQDLEHSLFLAPDEIRTCCKRFFMDKQMKGDVVLLSNKNQTTTNFTQKNILAKKQALFKEINQGVSDECSGCPFLEFKDWKRTPGRLHLNYISFEYHSVCNMRCIYCDDTYYGGQSSTYDIEGLVDSLIANEEVNTHAAIVWGGGEPTLDRHFPSLLSKMSDKLSGFKQRIISNATVYSPLVKELIDLDKVTLVTSIDAGTPETFNLVRGNKNFHDVFENLARYSRNAPQNVTIKYIVLDQNKGFRELRLFAQKIKEYKLDRCNFQVSCDFKKERLSLDEIRSIAYLYSLLLKMDVRCVFIDDLLKDRLYQSIDYDTLSAEINALDINYVLEDKNRLRDVVIWGAGGQSRNLIQNTSFFKQVNIKYFVDNTESKIGTRFMGYPVCHPGVLKDSDFPILISATQSLPIIMEAFENSGLARERLLKGIIL